MAMPLSYEMNMTSRTLSKKVNADIIWEPLLAFFPPTLLVKSIADLGDASAESASGIRFANAYSYCTLEKSCDPDYSIGSCWGWYASACLIVCPFLFCI
jgi:hypothetical protein